MGFNEIKRLIWRDFFEYFFYITIVASIWQRFWMQDMLAVRDIYAIAVIALLTSLANIFFYAKKELRISRLIIRHTISLVVGIIIVLSVAHFMGWILLREPRHVMAFVAMTLAVYMIDVAVDFFHTKAMTDEINKKIEESNE